MMYAFHVQSAGSTHKHSPTYRQQSSPNIIHTEDGFTGFPEQQKCRTDVYEKIRKLLNEVGVGFHPR